MLVTLEVLHGVISHSELHLSRRDLEDLLVETLHVRRLRAAARGHVAVRMVEDVRVPHRVDSIGRVQDPGP